MALSHLIDTSVIKRLHHSPIRAVVEPLAVAAALARATICDLEVGHSARNAREWDRLVGALDTFQPVETTAAHVNRARQVQRLLAARSQRERKVPDLLSAAAAEEHDLTVLHYDGDYDLIAPATGQRWRIASFEPAGPSRFAMSAIVRAARGQVGVAGRSDVHQPSN